MGFHDRAAAIAAAKGHTAADFTKAAQGHANATWILVICGCVAWYFLDWGFGVAFGIAAVYRAIKSMSSTAIAMRLEKRM